MVGVLEFLQKQQWLCEILIWLTVSYSRLHPLHLYNESQCSSAIPYAVCCSLISNVLQVFLDFISKICIKFNRNCLISKFNWIQLKTEYKEAIDLESACNPFNMLNTFQTYVTHHCYYCCCFTLVQVWKYLIKIFDIDKRLFISNATEIGQLSTRCAKR